MSIKNTIAKTIPLCKAVLMVIVLASTSRADFVVTVGSATGILSDDNLDFAPNSSVTLGLYLYNTSQTQDEAKNSFSFGFDLSKPGATDRYDGNDGFELSAFSDFSVSVVSPYVNDGSAISGPVDIVSTASNLINQYDVLLDLKTISNVALLKQGTQTTSVHIANISFKAAANLGPGVYGLKFNPNAQQEDNPVSLVSSVAGVDLSAGADGAFYNRFTITAVPEPSSLAFVGLVSVGMCLARRRRASV